MSSVSGLRDRHGLALATQSTGAAAAYVDGVDRLISPNAGADEALGRAIPYPFRGEVAEADAAVRRALALAPGQSRRERQRLAIVDRYVRGDAARALALAREPLAAFPRDAPVLSQIPFMLHAEGGDGRPIMLAVAEDLAPDRSLLPLQLRSAEMTYPAFLNTVVKEALLRRPPVPQLTSR
jgi:hypothetical protein